MIGCQHCGRWFHLHCLESNAGVEISEHELGLLGDWYCPTENCQQVAAEAEHVPFAPSTDKEHVDLMDPEKGDDKWHWRIIASKYDGKQVLYTIKSIGRGKVQIQHGVVFGAVTCTEFNRYRMEGPYK